MTKLLKSMFALALLLLPLGYSADAQESQAITLNFAATVGDFAAHCGETYTGVGADNAAVQFNDFRFYISNIQLLTSDGEPVPLALDQDGMWQAEGVALLDFEDGTASCSEAGNAALNGKITGTAPTGDYTGVIFDLGVPFELNHNDVTLAPSPLNVAAMWWNWQFGYKFVRIDLTTDATEVEKGWFIHLGSTACDSPAGAISPLEQCANPNLATISLSDFDFEQDVIVADLGSLLTDVALYDNTPMPPGCMSGTDDPDCNTLFPNFGLSLPDGICPEDDCSAQTFFRIANVTEVSLVGRTDMSAEMMSEGAMDMDHGSTGDANTEGEHNMSSDPEVIEMMSKHYFETPDNPLTVNPIVVVGDYAISSWAQGERGGRAFWQKIDGQWTALICSGTSLKEVETLVGLGMSQENATALAAVLAEAEAQLPAEMVALFDSFEGTVDLSGMGLEGHGEAADHSG